MSLGPFAVAVAVAFILAGLAYLVNSGRPTRTGSEVPPNLQPYAADEELEDRKLNRKLVAALFSSGFLALALPIYFYTEAGRQEAFEHRFEEESLHRGEEVYLEESAENPHGFGCIRCHGAEGVGGGASFTDPRTGATVTWLAPSLNDVFYRYNREEVLYWLIWGRPGSPMPAWGLEAGGPLNDQQLNDVMNYLESIQISQEEALANAEIAVTAELAAIETAPETIAAAISEQEVLIDEVSTAVARFAAGRAILAQVDAVLANREDGLDTDQDGLSDRAEADVNILSMNAIVDVAFSNTDAAALTLELDPDDPFTTEDENGEAVADLAAARNFRSEVSNLLAALGPIAENQETLLASAEQTRTNLLAAQEQAAYQIDFDALAIDAFGGDVETAERAYALYAAYCARCHTAGYSAGPIALGEPGSGALGPSLRDGRTIVQFPDREDHIEFILNGSVNGQGYGVNGIGRGWMPGFGSVLTQADIELIVDFERSLDD